jgi:CDP-6-deoxy-D-xylo-4-hexulose-3-dehydrase
VREGTGFTRDEIVRHLEERTIQTRMLFSGNLVRHPCFDEMRQSGNGYRIISTDPSSLSTSQQLNFSPSALPVTDRIMRDAFWIGVYSGLTEEMMHYIIDTVREFIKIKCALSGGKKKWKK